MHLKLVNWKIIFIFPVYFGIITKASSSKREIRSGGIEKKEKISHGQRSHMCPFEMVFIYYDCGLERQIPNKLSTSAKTTSLTQAVWLVIWTLHMAISPSLLCLPSHRGNQGLVGRQNSMFTEDLLGDIKKVSEYIP